MGMIIMGFCCARADKSILQNPSFMNIGIYVNLFVFFFFVNEGIELHIPRMLISIAQWWMVAVVCERVGAVKTVKPYLRSSPILRPTYQINRDIAPAPRVRKADV